MTSSVTNTTPINKPNLPSAAHPGSGQNVVEKNNPNKRGVGETLANVGGKAVEMGKSVAQNVAESGTNFAIEKGKEGLQNWLRMQLGHTLESICNLPFVGTMIAQLIAQTIFPIYKDLNPNTKLDIHAFQHMMKHGQVSELGEDIFPVFTNYLAQQLSEEEQQKLQQGSNMLMIKAFSKALYSQATEGINTARQPGGPRKIGNAIANWIPFVKNLPDSIKPWVGGAIGVFAAYKLARFALYLAKKALWIAGGIFGIKFLADKFGGGAGMPPGLPSMPAMSSHGHTGGHGEEAAPAGGGMMDKIMKGVSKAAEIAAQAQGGAGGHGAPGGGFGQALAALSGAGGGGH